jgi:2'-5' RNA ligase
MTMRYNLALIPTAKNKAFINLAQSFHKVSHQYLLGDNSLPHITLRHFETYESEITSIWQETLRILKNKAINIELSSFSYTTSDNQIYWISLLPNQQDVLNNLHTEINQILGSQPKKPYDPHLTLLNTKNNNYQNELNIIAQTYKPISDAFKLSLGRSDKIGQYLETLYQ